MVVELFDVELAAFKAWWLTGSSTRRAESTCDEYIRQLRHWHEWAEQQGLTTLTIRTARAYIAEVRARSEWAAVGAVRALKAFSKWRSIDDPAVADELAELPYLARPDTTRTPVAELDDIQAVLDTCATNSLEDIRDRAIICLLRATGMRRSELARMEWHDVDLKERTVFLPYTNTKSRKGRTVAFDIDTMDALRRYLRRLDQYEIDNCIDFEGTDRVWVGRLGPMTPNGIGQMITRRARDAGVDITTHSFRRSLAVRWLREGRSETLLQHVAGWADQTMIARYTKSVREQESLAQQRQLLTAEATSRQRATRGQRSPGGHRPSVA